MKKRQSWVEVLCRAGMATELALFYLVKILLNSNSYQNPSIQVRDGFMKLKLGLFVKWDQVSSSLTN
jgi:hypothetical protein